MKWIAAKVTFNFDNKALASDLISNIFYDLGLQGVVFEEPDIEVTDGIWDDTLKMPDDYSVIGYLPKTELTEQKCQELEKALAALQNDNNILTTIKYTDVDEEDWAESWKKYFKVEKISDKIIIKPTWEAYTSTGSETIIEIDPGMAFGTGTHPTTMLCIQMIEKYIQPKDSFLDIGTGSGILMVAAGKLGATKLLGIDIDEVAVEIAERNLLQNRINKEMFHVINGNLTDVVHQTFNLVTINILSEVIVELLENIKKILAPNGIIICSGIIEKNRQMVLKKMHALDFIIVQIASKDDWVAIVGTVKQ